jgi:hypothetical protein
MNKFIILVENPKERDHLGDLRGCKDNNDWILNKKSEGVDLIQLAQDRVQWQILENTVINLRVP